MTRVTAPYRIVFIKTKPIVYFRYICSCGEFMDRSYNSKHRTTATSGSLSCWNCKKRITLKDNRK